MAITTTIQYGEETIATLTGSGTKTLLTKDNLTTENIQITNSGEDSGDGTLEHSNLEDLAFAAGVESVGTNWTYVSFPRSFMSVPVVVVTIVGADSVLEASVRNITVDGFEVCIYHKINDSFIFTSGSGGEITKTSVGESRYVSTGTSWSSSAVDDIVTDITQSDIVQPTATFTQGELEYVTGTINYIACLDTGVGK